jgi:hypothetical protein
MRTENPVTFAKVSAMVPPASCRLPRRPRNMVEMMNLANHMTFMTATGSPIGRCFFSSSHIWIMVGHRCRACSRSSSDEAVV